MITLDLKKKTKAAAVKKHRKPALRSADKNALWQLLCRQSKKLPRGLELGCWEGGDWYGKSLPGLFAAYAKWGFKFRWVHLQFYASLDEEGNLNPPGFQDSRHQGEASIDYPMLLHRLKRINKAGYKAAVAVFFHNFETVSGRALARFFSRLSQDLRREKIDQIMFFPGWEVQGNWPAWPEGATRDCFIAPDDFNRQMELMKKARDAVGAKNILLAMSMAHDIDNRNYNYLSAPGWDYIPGLAHCDWIGCDYYTRKERGVAWNFNDARTWYEAVVRHSGQPKSFGIFEYSYETNDYSRWPKVYPLKWSDQEVAHFITETFAQLRKNRFIKQLHWWFIGRLERIAYRGKR